MGKIDNNEPAQIGQCEEVFTPAPGDRRSPLQEWPLVFMRRQECHCFHAERRRFFPDHAPATLRCRLLPGCRGVWAIVFMRRGGDPSPIMPPQPLDVVFCSGAVL